MACLHQSGVCVCVELSSGVNIDLALRLPWLAIVMLLAGKGFMCKLRGAFFTVVVFLKLAKLRNKLMKYI